MIWRHRKDPSGRGTPSPFPRSAFPLSLLALFAAILLLSACDDGGEQLLQRANDEWIKGRNHSAIEMFKTVLKKYPSGPSAEEALFRLGEIYHFSLNDSAKAIIFFQELLDLNRKGPFSYGAQKHIAEIVEFGFKDYNQAIIEYQNLINNYAGRGENANHQFRIASIYYKIQNYEQAAAELDVLMEKYGDSPIAEEAEFKLIEILYALNRCDAVRTHYGRYAAKYPGSRHRAEVEFVIASCLEDEGHLQEAYERFKGLENDYQYPPLLKMKLEGIEKRIQKKR